MKLGTTLVLLIGALGVGAAAFWLVWTDGSAQRLDDEIQERVEAERLLYRAVVLDDITRLQIERNNSGTNERWVYSYEGSGWWQTEPKVFAVSGPALQPLLDAANEVRRVNGTAPAASEKVEGFFGFHSPRMGWVVQEYRLGPRSGAGLAAITYGIDEALLTSDELHNAVAEWDGRTVLADRLRWPGYGVASRIALRHPRGAWVMEREGGRWVMVEGGTGEQGQGTQPGERVIEERLRVRDFLRQVEDLEVAGFADGAGTERASMGLEPGVFEFVVDRRRLRVGQPVGDGQGLWFAEYDHDVEDGMAGVVFLVRQRDLGRLAVPAGWFFETRGVD
ncbi:MAG: hypothetical protein AAGI68_13780 [Planctomycetota bacterium]